MKIKELLVTEDKWAKVGFAYDKEGKMVSSTAPEAVKWCLLGAATICYGDDHQHFEEVVRLIVEYVEGQSVRYVNVGGWNDTPERTFADVRKLVEELDI